MSLSGGLDLPRVIGHRGAASIAPENTLAAIRAAAGAGAKWVEFDVRLTADRRCVVIHDAGLKRTTGRAARVAALSFTEIRRLDAGGWFGPQFAGEKVPELTETLDLVDEVGLGANLELKPSGPRNRDLASAVASLIGPKNRVSGPEILVSSRSAVLLGEIRDAGCVLPQGLVMRVPRPDWRNRTRRLGCASLHCRADFLTPALVAEIKQAGLSLAAFTVDDPAQARLLWSWGVDTLFSNNPGRLLAEAA